MSRTPRRLHDDPGLQPERTALAWARTAISLAVVSMLWLRWSHVLGGTVLVMTTLMVAAAAAIYWTQGARYRNSAAGLSRDHVPADLRGVFALTAAMLLFGIGSIVLILTG